MFRLQILAKSSAQSGSIKIGEKLVNNFHQFLKSLSYLTTQQEFNNDVDEPVKNSQCVKSDNLELGFLKKNNIQIWANDLANYFMDLTNLSNNLSMLNYSDGYIYSRDICDLKSASSIWLWANNENNITKQYLKKLNTEGCDMQGVNDSKILIEHVLLRMCDIFGSSKVLKNNQFKPLVNISRNMSSDSKGRCSKSNYHCEKKGKKQPKIKKDPTPEPRYGYKCKVEDKDGKSKPCQTKFLNNVNDHNVSSTYDVGIYKINDKKPVQIEPNSNIFCDPKVNKSSGLTKDANIDTTTTITENTIKDNESYPDNELKSILFDANLTIISKTDPFDSFDVFQKQKPKSCSLNTQEWMAKECTGAEEMKHETGKDKCQKIKINRIQRELRNPPPDVYPKKSCLDFSPNTMYNDESSITFLGISLLDE